MKNLELNALDLVELDSLDLKHIDGGGINIFKLTCTGFFNKVKHDTEVDCWIFGFKIF
jgi:hypothetical protein